MSLIENKNIKIGINSIDIHIYNVIHDTDNTISENDKDTLIHLYNQFKPLILQGFVGKRMDDIGSIFWQNIVVHMMIALEDLLIGGPTKKDLLIETVGIVIRHDLGISDQDRVLLETQFRKIAHSIIDIVIFASKNINKKYKKTRTWSLFKSFSN
jgi:hypothetical protein